MLVGAEWCTKLAFERPPVDCSAQRLDYGAILRTMKAEVGWEIDVPFQQKIGYIENTILGGDLVLPS